LVAQKFDAGSRKIAGTPIPLESAPQLQGAAGAPGISTSSNGIMIRTSSGIENTQLQWVDRSGHHGAFIPVPPGQYAQVGISPDGQRAVVERYSDPNSMDLWMVDLARGMASRFTHIPSCRIF